MSIEINKQLVINKWDSIKKGNKELMAGVELDYLEDYIKEVSEKDYDLFVLNFRSLYKKELQIGIYSKCYECWMS